ncbi:hypothetical protein Tco_0313870 [Tanacetum coccineum]
MWTLMSWTAMLLITAVSSGPTLHEMDSLSIVRDSIPKPSFSTHLVPPFENVWDLLFQPIFPHDYNSYVHALFCYYDAFLTSVEPKNYKDALTQACWIEAMQEELHEFERLEVWELVPPPDKVFVISLK